MRKEVNVVWICHALPGVLTLPIGGAGLFSEGRFFDPGQYFIICANVLGGCYGSTGHLSFNPATGKQFFHTFPTVTNRDVVRLLICCVRICGSNKCTRLLVDHLGGQQVLEWAIYQPDVFQHIVPIATNASHSPWGIAFNEAQRLAIEADQYMERK